MYHQRFKTPDQRFDEKFTVDDNGCWLWKTGSKERHPDFFIGGRYIKASHFSWQRANGRQLLEGEQVLHKCDTPKCVNPNHLFIGDHLENMKDKASKGRSHKPRGALNGRARVTRFVVEIIRREYQSRKVSQQKLADKYGLGQSTVSHIIRNKTWKD